MWPGSGRRKTTLNGGCAPQQSLPCEGNSCDSFLGSIPQTATHVARPGTEITACDVTTLLPNSRSQLSPDAHHRPPPALGQCHQASPVTSHLAKVSRDAVGQGQNFSEVPAQHCQAQQPFCL